jgi:hypothetical protein
MLFHDLLYRSKVVYILFAYFLKLKQIICWLRTMNLIAYEPHFWELYRDDNQYYLSIAVDMSSVVSCWDLVLNQDEIQAYEHRGRASIQELAKRMIEQVYKGDFSNMESRLAKSYERHAMQSAYKMWQDSQKAD